MNAIDPTHACSESDGPTWLADSVSAQLQQLGIGGQDYFQVHLGADAPELAWTTRRAMLANEAAEMRALVENIVERRPALARKTVWPSMHQACGWPVVELCAQYLAGAGRLLRFDPDDARLGLDLTGDEPGVRGLWLTKFQVMVVDADPWASIGHPLIEVVTDANTLGQTMASDTEAFLFPFVEVVRSQVRLGRRGLWGMTFDGLVHPFAQRRESDAGPADQHQRVASLTRSFRGTVFDRATEWVEFEHDGVAHASLRTTSCCLAYQWPSVPEQEARRDSCDRAWDNYCTSCPLIPKVETMHRAKFWLDHADQRH